MQQNHKIYEQLLKEAEPDGVSVSRFIELCLSSQSGYYVTRNPIGNDFITSPEIYPAFGDMIAVWIRLCYESLRSAGAAQKLRIIEAGPGRGTLMQQIWKCLPQDIKEHTDVVCWEMSPVLWAMQQQALSMIPSLTRIESIQDLDNTAPYPCIIIGNEFLDAIPVDQYIYTCKGWKERKIFFDQTQFVFKEGASVDLPQRDSPPQVGDILEISPQRSALTEQLLHHISPCGGAILWIDYGYTTPGYGDTLQGLARSQYAHIFENLGETDLSTHVDFAALYTILHPDEKKIFTTLCSQRSFLKQLGCEARIAYLLSQPHLSPETKERLYNGYIRVTESMGLLFNVLSSVVLPTGAPS